MGALAYDIRQALQTAAQGVTGGGYTLTSARVILGYDDLALNNTYRASLATDGPLMAIRRARLLGNDPTKPAHASYQVPVDLWIGVARATDQTFVNEETLVEAVKTAWARYWIEWDYDPLDVSANPAVAHYMINVRYEFGC